MESELGFLISVLIICADISAGVLGIEAEIAQSMQQQNHHHQQQQQHSRNPVSQCQRNPSSDAFVQGIAALVLLGIVHITANVLGGCIYIRSKQDFKRATANKILAVAFLVLSWILFGVGYSTLMLGTLANSKSHRFCNLPNRWLFLIGGIICLVHGFVTSAYYVSATAAKKEDKENNMQQETPENRSRA